MISTISAFVWLAIAGFGFWRIRAAYRGAVIDLREVIALKPMGSILTVKLELVARNQLFRYRLRRVTILNDLLIGVVSVASLILHAPIWFSAAFGFYVLLSLLGNELVIVTLTEHDIWTRELLNDGTVPPKFLLYVLDLARRKK